MKTTDLVNVFEAALRAPDLTKEEKAALQALGSFLDEAYGPRSRDYEIRAWLRGELRC